MRLKVVYTVCNTAAGTRSTYIARTPAGSSIGGVTSSSSSSGGIHAHTTLKSCLALICYTRPDLVPTAQSDYAISVLDVVESSKLGPQDRVFEGKGMMGWLLAETQNGTTRVVGKLVEELADSADNGGNAVQGETSKSLEVVLELIPRLPVNRNDFLSSLTSGQTAPAAPLAAAVPANPANPPGSTNDMAQAMMAALLSMNNGQAPPQMQQMFMQMMQDQLQQQQQPHSNNNNNNNNNNSALLPGINLFNPGRVMQNQPSTNTRATSTRPLPEPTKQSSQQLVDSGTDQPAITTKKAATTTKTKKYWGPGCLKCGITESTQWRVRKKRSKPLDGSQASAGTGGDGEEVKKLCEDCAQDLPSMQKKRAEEAAAAAANTTDSRGETASTSKQSASTTIFDETGRPRARPSALARRANQQQKQPAQIQTSPLRRSPRRLHATVVPNVRQQAKDTKNNNASSSATFLQPAQPFTSPSRAPSDGAATLGKRRKFTSALSAVALREELSHNGSEIMHVDSAANVPAKKRRITPTNLSKSVSSSSIFRSPAFGTTGVFGGNEEDEISFLGASASYCNRDTGKQKAQAKQIFDLTSPKRDSTAPPNAGNAEMKDWLMNASPGTAIRSILGESAGTGTPRAMSKMPSFASVEDTPGKMFGRYLLDGLNLPAGLSSFDIPHAPAHENGVGVTPGTQAVHDFTFSFSPLGNTLSTPFRNAIFHSTVTGTPSGSSNSNNAKRISPPRATSEQPPPSHEQEKLSSSLFQQQMLGDNIGQSGISMHLSSDDTNLGYSTLGAGNGHPQIQLLPPTADRSRILDRSNGSLVDMQASEFTSDHPSSYPDGILDDFSSFLLKTSSSLMTSPSPPRKQPKQAIKASSLAPLAFPNHLSRRHSTPTPLNLSSAPLSSEFDIDLDPQLDNSVARDLPPSSPPPLPSATSASQSYQNYFDNLLAGFTVPIANGDDGQSPVSVGTSATQGGTPQEHPLPINGLRMGTDYTAIGNGSKGLSPNGTLRAPKSSDSSLSLDVSLAEQGGSVYGVSQSGAADQRSILDDIQTGEDDDPLLSFFGGSGNRTQSNSKAHKLRISSESMALTWSESTGTSSSSSFMEYGSQPGRAAVKEGQNSRKEWSAATTPSDLFSPVQDGMTTR